MHQSNGMNSSDSAATTATVPSGHGTPSRHLPETRAMSVPARFCPPILIRSTQSNGTTGPQQSKMKTARSCSSRPTAKFLDSWSPLATNVVVSQVLLR